jgi:hypothetical protein
MGHDMKAIEMEPLQPASTAKAFALGAICLPATVKLHPQRRKLHGGVPDAWWMQMKLHGDDCITSIPQL